MKVNIDGAARGSPAISTAGGRFRDNNYVALGCFSIYLGIQFAYFAEFFVAITTIELAFR